MAVSINIDVEATNRCSAVCHFCPRGTTPHQGHMTMATFDQSLQRAIEFRETKLNNTKSNIQVKPNICGLAGTADKCQYPGLYPYNSRLRFQNMWHVH